MSPSGLDRSSLDPDALRAVERLQEHGHEAYLVGGCVRDLLLGQRPKDFDIATSAKPQNVKRTFPRNCRIIGRRFKLAHLHFDRNTKILEVSTFRRAPEPTEEGDEDLLITRDNEFGTLAEDALRRDFTINSLFYDPVHDEIVDHTGGLDDIERHLVRTIGDPYVRFREDPVRILRAIKFSGRLGLSLDPQTEAAMREVAPDLVRSAPPRLLEEILRLLRGGHAVDAFLQMRDLGVLEAILPQLDDYLRHADRDEAVLFWRGLEALDGRAARALGTVPADGHQPEWPPENGVVLAVLFHRAIAVATAEAGRRSPSSIAEELLSPFATAYRLPRRDTGCLKRICSVQHRFDGDTEGRRFRAESFVRNPYFGEALQLRELAAIAAGEPLDSIAEWRERAGLAEKVRPEPIETDEFEREEGPRKRRRKRGGKGGDRAGGERQGGADEGRSRDKRKPGKDKPRGEARKADKKGAKKVERRPDIKADKKKRPRKGREIKIETIEPAAMDLSAFDVELDPKRVPTFGTIVEQDTGKKKKRHLPAAEDEYRPPPPPEDGGAPPPPPPTHDGDSFGDW